MTRILWDQTGQKVYETGVDHGVLYLANNQGVYNNGWGWNGLTTITESPSGAESNPQYADNIKYVDLQSAEEFGATIEAFTYPDQFAQCDGSAVFNGGVALGQQSRRPFGLSYRTQIGNDIAGNAAGYKLHLIYGATAAPSEKAYSTINDSPEPITFSWEVTTTPAPVGTVNGTDYKPTASITIDSTKVDAAKLALLENLLYGTAGTDPSLPTPAEVIALMTPGAVTTVSLGLPANQPTYNSGTRVVTLPTVTGVQWRINGVNKTPGAQPAAAAGTNSLVEAVATNGYVLSATSVNKWSYDHV